MEYLTHGDEGHKGFNSQLHFIPYSIQLDHPVMWGFGNFLSSAPLEGIMEPSGD